MSLARSQMILTMTSRRQIARNLTRVHTIPIACHRRFHRHFDVSPSAISPQQENILDDWIFETLKATRQYHDDLSSSKIADLYSTLPTRDLTDESAFSRGKPLEPIHSLAFFNPRPREEQLGDDQTAKDFGPPPPFTRRMWAGGVFRFPGPRGSDESLKIGQDSTAHIEIGKIEKKGFEKGRPMVFVHQNIDYAPRDAGHQPVISEERIHVYLPHTLRADTRAVREVSGLPKPQYTFSWTPTPTTLFRFSALTWNAHLIHLDPTYAREVEGYLERLVHGPLTALMLIEALRHEAYSGRIDNYVYRARNPVLVGRRQHLRGAFNVTRDKAIVWAEDDDGIVGMTATVDLLDPKAAKVWCFSALS